MTLSAITLLERAWPALVAGLKKELPFSHDAAVVGARAVAYGACGTCHDTALSGTCAVCDEAISAGRVGCGAHESALKLHKLYEDGLPVPERMHTALDVTKLFAKAMPAARRSAAAKLAETYGSLLPVILDDLVAAIPPIPDLQVLLRGHPDPYRQRPNPAAILARAIGTEDTAKNRRKIRDVARRALRPRKP